MSNQTLGENYRGMKMQNYDVRTNVYQQMNALNGASSGY